MGRIASMLGMEGGHAIENSMGALRAFFDLGVRYMTLTHSASIDWADAGTGEVLHGGLTRFGEEVVRALEASDHKNAFIDIGGPKAYNRREIAEVAFAALGTPPKIKVRPAWILKLVAYCMRPFNYNVYSLLRFMHFVVTTPDMTGDHYVGRRYLEDHFRMLTEEDKETGTFAGRDQVE